MAKLPIVFAPGLMCDARLFEAQAAALSGDRQTLVADFAQDDSILGMAARLLKDAPTRFYLAGLSMGAIVAFDVWRQAGHRLAGLALLNSTPFADSPARRAVRISQIDRVRKGSLKTVVMEELKPNYLAAAHKKDQALMNEIYGMAERLGPDVFVDQSRALMNRQDSSDTLGRITCPTLIIAGEDDEVCPPELHEIMRNAIRGSSIHVIPECGHLSTMESPDAVTQLLKIHIANTERTLAA